MVLVENFNVSIPSKVHEVFCHVTDWYDRHPDLFLGRFSEQSDESLHSKFKKFCEQRNLIKNIDSPNYGSSLCLAVATFNFQFEKMKTKKKINCTSSCQRGLNHARSVLSGNC